MSDASFTTKESAGGRAGGRTLSGWTAYRRLFASLSLFWIVFPLSMVFIVLGSFAPSAFRWYAGSLAESAGPHALPYVGWTVVTSPGGLLIIGVIAMVLRILAWMAFEITGMWSAQGIHAEMVKGLGGTRTTFFDENPSGRLINRLVRDYDEVRSTAIIFVGDILNSLTEVLSVAILALIVSPWAALMLLPFLGAFYAMHWYRSGMLAHAEGLSSVAVSRVLDRKTDLVEGREIFLLYGRGQRLLERMSASYRRYIRAKVLSSLLSTWASFWIRMSAEAYSLMVLVLLIFMLSRRAIDTTTAGVVISVLFGIRLSVAWLDFATSLISQSIPHVQRVFEFADLPREELEERAVPVTTAGITKVRRGDIEFARYSMSYRPDTPEILHEIDLHIREGSKTAIVGRTGSGKTSVMQALFRMVYVRSGDIRIGGESIFDSDLDSVRTLFGVVPQHPYLFAGDLRANLDRSGTLPEATLKAALDAVGLEFGLDHPVLEGGKNMSVGERQLACLARIIAADRPFVLMDEPTSGLDPETDARIHRVLHTTLASRTVITIAHRQESLGSYDQVVELEAGRVVG